MIRNEWDADLAVTYGSLEEALEGQPTIDRYGITEFEEITGEPLTIALAQEEPDVAVEDGSDDPWAFVDPEWEADERLLSRIDDPAPEEAAMHLVRL